MIDDDYHGVSITGLGNLSVTNIPTRVTSISTTAPVNMIFSGGGSGTNISHGGSVGSSGVGGAAGGTYYSMTWAGTVTPSPQPFSVKGDATFDGDISIKGKSLTDTLERIEQRLGILHPNEELEEIWTELKELGDRYRELVKNIPEEVLEKKSVWDLLKK